MAASCTTFSGPMDLMDAHIQCPVCLGIKDLRETLVDPFTECNLMPFEVRQQTGLKFKIHQHQPEPRFRLVVSVQLTKLNGLQGRNRPPLQHYPPRWLNYNAVQGIQALLAMSFPFATLNVNEEMGGSVSTSSLPRFKPAAECSREELGTLSLAALDSLIVHEHECFAPLEETSSLHSQSQHSHSDEGSGVQGAGSSVVFSL